MVIGEHGQTSVNVMKVHKQEVDNVMIDLPNQMDRSILQQVSAKQKQQQLLLLLLPLLPPPLLLLLLLLHYQTVSQS